jgi:aminoglycoside 6'-N-acetyltransferase
LSLTFRPLRYDDFPNLARWHSAPHVVRWWTQAPDLESLTDEYGDAINGDEPTEFFVVELDGEPVGLIQHYRLVDHPDWAQALAHIELPDAAGIDYLIGEENLIGRGIGGRAIAAFCSEVFARYPEITIVIAAPQQANIASWRALEKAGFVRLWAGQLDSPDPDDKGPSYVYGLRRP